MDVAIAFSSAFLPNEVYMPQPKGFIYPAYPKKVFQLMCSIHGLRQTTWLWFKKFNQHLLQAGFIASTANNVYIKKD
jgi:hypothetical protein